MRSLEIFCLVGLICVFFGCGAKPEIDIYIEPVAGREGIEINQQLGSVAIEQNGVAIMIEPLDEVEVYELVAEGEINPYLRIGRWGQVDPLYTVFEIRVKNLDHSRVAIDNMAILIDEDGTQYGSLPYDYFKDLYRNARTTDIYRSAYPYRYQYGRFNNPYYDPYYDNRMFRTTSGGSQKVQSAQMVARETVFDGGKIFRDGQRSGLLVFDLLDREAKDLKLIVPEVMIFDQDRLKTKMDFAFDFQQIIGDKEIIFEK